jgi:hypothetical protein
MNDWKTSFKGASIYAKILEGLYNLIYRNLIYRPKRRKLKKAKSVIISKDYSNSIL